MKKRYLECGKIVTTHGIKGELKVEPWCDTPEFLAGFKALYLKGREQPLEVEGSRVHKSMVILKVRGVDSIDEGVTLRGKIVYIDREDAPGDEAGRYFIQDLIGLAVRNVDSGRDYGRVAQVLSTGANDVYVLRDDQGVERLIPAIPQVVLELDVDGGTMGIRPLEGLFEDED